MSDEQEKPNIAEESKEEIEINSAIQHVLKEAMFHDGVIKGLNEVCKCIDRNEAQLCILAQDCSEDQYKRLVKTLCQVNSVPILNLEKGEDLGLWLGICKFDKEGNPKKVKRVSSVVIKDFGEDNQYYAYVTKWIKDHHE